MQFCQTIFLYKFLTPVDFDGTIISTINILQIGGQMEYTAEHGASGDEKQSSCWLSITGCCLAITFLLMASEHLLGQSRLRGVCRFEVQLVNQDRSITGHHLSAECGGIHSAPFGNWGVESTLGEKRNSRQFDGWKLSDGFFQWNSCTSDTTKFPTGCDAPGGPYYNSAACTQQFSVVSTRDIHAGVFPNVAILDFDVPCPNGIDGGCKSMELCAVALENHFMDLFELDPFSPADAQVGRLEFGTQSAPALCATEECCENSISPWKSDTDSSSGISAQAALYVRNGRFLDLYGLCN